MYSFVILGQIPGTNITISFMMWAQLGLVALVAVIGLRYINKQKIDTTEQRSNVMVVRGGKPVSADEISL